MPTPTRFVPKVIVKFKDEIRTLPYADGIGTAIDSLGIGDWNVLAQRFQGISIRRANAELEPQKVNTLVDRAVTLDPTYRPRNLLNYYVVDCPSLADAEGVAEALKHWANVETAYVAMVPHLATSLGYEDPPVSGPPGAGGINAVYARSVPGGQGDGQFVADLELGWKFDHDAISHFGLSAPAKGVNSTTLGDYSHGTSVLGIIGGKGTLVAAGCSLATTFVGIAPNISAIPLSMINSGAFDETLIPPRIQDAIDLLPMGGILLLEFELNGLPAETRLQCFDWLRLATALGIVVIEPAGNNSVNLDTYQDPITNEFLLLPTHSDFRESGAIMVACGSETHLASVTVLTGAGVMVNAFGNYGCRINCWAWGDGNACAPKSTRPGDTGSYGGFEHTSAAAAIIAGAAASVQGMMWASAQNRRFSPGELRTILSDPNNGTYATGTYAGLLGVMPDLEQIARNVLNVAPDIYGRDYVGDPGDPNGGAHCTSPDIIVRNNPISGSPQAFCGEGTSRANDDQLSDPVKSGSDNYLYVRLRNRGGQAATNVDVDVYYADPATLILPVDWTWIGRTRLASVPSGNQLTVSDAIVWPSGRIPASGHYCFIAIAGNPEDPAPPLAGSGPGALAPANSWDRFLELIGRNNNVTWRNFNVVPPDPSPGSPLSAVELPFEMVGPPDQSRSMQLEVKGFLPPRSLLGFEAPVDMLTRWGFHTSDFVHQNRTQAVIRANPTGLFHTPYRAIPAGARIPIRLHAQIPQELRNGAYIVSARQLYQGRELGRVTWCLRRSPRRGIIDIIRGWRPFDWGG